jgi:hypothetical protein
MAGLPEAMDRAIEIALTLAKTQNVTIHEDVAQIALSVPPAKAVRLAPLLAKWLPPRFRMLLPRKLGDLVSHLSKGGEAEAALKLAESLLRIVPDRRFQNDLIREARPAIDDYQFAQILDRNIPDLIDAAGLRALRLLSDQLARAVTLSRRSQQQESGEDHSEIWRPRLDAECFPERALDSLVSAVRDSATRVVAQDPTLLAACAHTLASGRWLIFKRLAFDLVRTHLDVAPSALVQSLLVNRTHLRRLLPEYRGLLRDGFTQLDAEDQMQVLEWIEAGPDLDRWKTGQKNVFGRTPTDDETVAWGRRWSYERLATIGDGLPASARDVLTTLTQEFGLPKPYEPPRMSQVWMGPTSPKTQADLDQMRPEAVIDFLSEWRPAAGPREASPEGLGRVLTQVVESRAQEFSMMARAFRVVDPTYVRSFISGLVRAAKQGEQLAWAELLGLINWVLEQPTSVTQAGDEDRDPGWSWTRKESSRLLEAGLEAESGGIPFALRHEVWHALARLAEDAEPTPEYEAEYGGTNMDPATLALNTVRGQAFHTAMRYGLWTRGHLETERKGGDTSAVTFAQIPELATLLERHLDPAVDASLAIRSVYGQWFPWLLLIDPGWAEANRSQVYPQDDTELARWSAAWDAYVVFCRPFDAVFAALRDTYRLAITRLGQRHRPDQKATLRDPDRSLAEHLMVLYGRGQIPQTQDSLLALFFETAPVEIRAYAIEFVGRSLSDEPPGTTLPSDVVQRFMALWQWRLEHARQRAAGAGSEPAEELTGLGAWFGSGVFPEDWSFEQLQAVVELGGKVEPDHVVVRRLVHTVNVRPLASARALKAIVDADAEGWSLFGWEAEASEILRVALASGNGEAAETARALIHQLGSSGHFGFRGLLGDDDHSPDEAPPNKLKSS